MAETGEQERKARRSRYRLLLYLLLLLAATDFAVRWFRETWESYDPNEYRARLISCRHGRWDLVLIGGSAVAEGLDPDSLKGLYWHGANLERTFNLGLGGATTTTIWHAVEHGIVAPPRLLVYGITATDLNDSRDEPNDVWTLMDLADVKEWLERRPGQGEWCLRHYLREHLARRWQLYYHRNGIRLWAMDLAEQRWPGTFPDAGRKIQNAREFNALLHRPNGFAPRPENTDHTLADLKVMNLVEPRFSFLEGYRLGGHLQYLHRILDWATQRRVEVVLVDMPVAEEVEINYPEAFAAYRSALFEVERRRGVPVLRPTRASVGLNICLFSDRIHLNAPGRELMNAWLRAHLADLGKASKEVAHAPGS
jgi:hypothetical protein